MMKEKTLELKETIELIKQHIRKEKQEKPIPDALISAEEKHTIKEELIQRMEKLSARPKTRQTGNRLCRFCRSPNYISAHIRSKL